MAGQHIEREARYEATGMTTEQRKQRIAELHAQRWTQRRIAAELNISQPAVCKAIQRLEGRRPEPAKYGMCVNCWDDGRLNREKLCAECGIPDPLPPRPEPFLNVDLTGLTAFQAIYK